MAIDKGTMRQVPNNIYQILIKDEELLRLLYYYPKSSTYLDPLDPELPNIVDSEIHWDIIDDRILLAEKDSDLNEKAICRIYITQGRRRPVFGSYILVDQEIIISIYTHEKYWVDSRNEWIFDRISELITLEYIEGILGQKFEYFGGNPRVTGIGYKRYDHIYQYVTGKK